MTPRPALPAHPRAFQRFLQAEAAGGLLLLSCAVAAFAVANSPWTGAYRDFWSTPIVIGVAGRSLSLTLTRWINDGLMTIFFLLVGLEIKREFVAGELASARQAALPIAGAIGGMILPALVYLLVAGHGPLARGWGIPMATDIAFALGALTLIAPRAPLGGKVFLTALAIVDDVGAVAVIAAVYTREFEVGLLLRAALAMTALVGLNAARVNRLAPYLLAGGVLWLLLHASGLHATLAGVLMALAVPTRTRINAVEFSAEARALLDDFDATETGDYLVLTSPGQQEAIYALERATEAVNAPLLRLERALHGLSAFVVMPLFALANAGVGLGGSPIAWRLVAAIALGLAIGKPLGITLAARGAVSLKLAQLPARVGWRLLYGYASIGGIGFTMSLFIATLAFEGTTFLDSAKLGVLGGSVLSGLAATVVLRLAADRS